MINCDILIPTWNNLQYLLPCINSILQHTVADSFQIVIINNGDPEHMEEFKNPNIKPGVYGFNLLIADAKSEELYLNVLNKKTDGFEIENHERLLNFAIDGDIYPMNAVVELESEWHFTEVDPSEHFLTESAING